MNAGRAPKQVVNAHPPDQHSQVCGDPRPASQGARFPAPVAAKAGTMPAHKSLGPDDRYGLEHGWKTAIQLEEEQTFVDWTRPRTPAARSADDRSAAFSASSRLFDLNGEANSLKMKHSSATIMVDVKRFAHQINTDEVFGTHKESIYGSLSHMIPLHRYRVFRSVRVPSPGCTDRPARANPIATPNPMTHIQRGIRDKGVSSRTTDETSAKTIAFGKLKSALLRGSSERR